MKIGSALSRALFVGPFFVACASSSDEAPPPPAEDILDASANEVRAPETGPDADGDVRVRDAGAPKRLAIVCEGAPCYVAISGNGSGHLCGLLEDKSVRCWGDDGDGDRALGRGAPVSPPEGATPAPVVGLPGPVDRLRVGPNLGTCARTLDGGLYCWGRNDRGQLGFPPERPRLLVPTRLEGLPPVEEVALGFGRGCAIATGDRALYCWGSDEDGVFEPPHVMAGFTPPVSALAIGNIALDDTIVALLAKDTLAATGHKPPYGDSHFPTDPVRRAGVTRIAPFAFTAADGSFRRWLPREEKLYFPSSSPIVELEIVGDENGAYRLEDQPGGAVTTSGELFRWGRNTKGELGTSPNTLQASAYPVEVLQVRAKVAAFATAHQSTCALLVDGKIRCWGANAFGELGRGTVDFGVHPEPELIR